VSYFPWHYFGIIVGNLALFWVVALKKLEQF